MLGNTRKKEESTNQKHIIVSFNVYLSSLPYISVLVANIADARWVGAQLSDLLLAARGDHTKSQSPKAQRPYASVQYM